MTYKNLFSIILKIIGLIFLKQTIELIPQFIQIVSFATREGSSENILLSIFRSAFAVYAWGGLFIVCATILLFKTPTRPRLQRGCPGRAFSMPVSSLIIFLVSIPIPLQISSPFSRRPAQ